MPRISQEDLEHVLSHTRSVWDEARGGNFFITGGTGFFGTWLIESLDFVNRQLSLGIRATVLSRDPAAFLRKCPHLASESWLHFIEGDVRDWSCEIEKLDYVIHAAAESTARQPSQPPLEVFATIVDGTQRVLDFAARCGARKFLLTSSGAIYGPQPPSISHISEDFFGGPDCLDATNVYAEGKRAAELLSILHARSDFEIKIARCFAFVGPYLSLDAHFAIGNFMRDAMRGGPIVITGDGSPRRSYLYAADLAIWLWVVLFRGASGRAYNVGSEVDVMIAELARAVTQATDPDVSVLISQPLDALAPRKQYVPSTERAQTELGLRQIVMLEDAIARTVRWHQAAIPGTKG